MYKICSILVLILLPLNLWATDDKLETELKKLWSEGKITPEQPFKAKVIAAGGLSPWSGKTVLYLREEKGKKRILKALIGIATDKGVHYEELTAADFEKVLKWEGDSKHYDATVYITPVEVSQFVCTSPLGYIGKKFGESDLVNRSYKAFLKEKGKKEKAR